ncbi:MAG: PHP domain-containing protein [Alphaproteobacteria bacterium]|nr:PHP domain-containing protein [Alphaproteobacteria bacterium]
MKQKYTLHTHTCEFDGNNTITEMVNRAKELGFDTIGISNHFIVHPLIKASRMYKFAVQGGYSAIYSESFDEVMKKFVPHYENLEQFQSLNPDIKILREMEVDFFNSPQWRKGFEKCVAILQPDYVIGSGHFIEYNNTLLNSHDWKGADYGTQAVLLKQYWHNIANAAHSGLFTWMAHLDLPKKVGLGSEDRWQQNEATALDAIRESKTAMEINTGLYRSNCYEPYPSNRILSMAGDIPVLISDDAHADYQIGRHFDEAEQLINQFKLRKFQLVK